MYVLLVDFQQLQFSRFLGQPVPKQQQTPVRPSEDQVSEESSVVPSFQDAFNEAFESATQKGKVIPTRL